MILRDLTFNEVLSGHSYLSVITTYNGGNLLVDAANVIAESITGETDRLCFMTRVCLDLENIDWTDIQNHVSIIDWVIRHVIEQRPCPKGYTEHWQTIIEKIKKC